MEKPAPLSRREHRRGPKYRTRLFYRNRDRVAGIAGGVLDLQGNGVAGSDTRRDLHVELVKTNESRRDALVINARGVHSAHRDSEVAGDLRRTRANGNAVNGRGAGCSESGA